MGGRRQGCHLWTISARVQMLRLTYLWTCHLFRYQAVERSTDLTQANSEAGFKVRDSTSGEGGELDPGPQVKVDPSMG